MREVQSAAGTAITDATASAPRFVGRQSVLQELTEAVEGGASVVLVEGEAGIGKTRLLTEALVGADVQARTLWVSCPPLPEPYTLGPVVDALLDAASDRVPRLTLSQLAGALRPLFPEWGDHLPPALEPAADATAARHRVFRALVELLAALEVDRIVVDDLQWSDEVTREFLLFLADGRPRRLCLVLAFRAPEVGGDDWLLGFTTRLRPSETVVRLALEPLDLSGTAAIASSMLADQPVSQAFARHLHGHTGGLPLAVEESVRLMVRRKDLVWRDGAWMRLPLAEIVVPPTLRDTVLEQVRRLGGAATSVLRTAAVAGEPLAEAALLDISGLPVDAFHQGLSECVDHGLLRRTSDRRVAFRHVLAGRAVYEATPEEERRGLHQRTGRRLELDFPPPLARLASHFRLAGDEERWERYADRAVDVALETGDEATAGALLHQLVRGSNLSAERLCALVDKVPFGSLPASLHLRDLAAVLRGSLADSHPPAVEADLRFQLSRVLNELDEFEAAREEVELALPHLERDPASVAVSMLVLAWPRGRSPKSTHLGWIERAQKLARDLPATEQLRVETVCTAGLLLLGDDGGWSGAEMVPEMALNSRERRIVTMAHANLGDAALRWGRFAEAKERLATARRLAADYDQIRIAELVECTQVHLDLLTGAWEGLATRARDLADNEDIRPVSRLEPLMVQALLRLAGGESAAGAEMLRLVLAGARDSGAWESVAEPAAALARLHLRERRPAEALATTEEPVRRVLDTGIWLWGTAVVPVRIEALAEMGELEDARRLTAAFAGLVGDVRSPAAAAALRECEALVAAGERSPAAAGLLEDAGERWAALPQPYRSALCHERRGDLLVATGRVDAGLDVLGETLAAYSALPASADVDRVAHTLRVHGRAVPRAWRGGRKGYGSELSPREREVVALAAEGLTNREIAHLLHRSHHTVATQLRSAMRKVDASSRAALVAKVATAGLLDDSHR